MRWIIARKERSFARVELWDAETRRTLAYINIEGSIKGGYEWSTGTTIFGFDVKGGKFKDESLDLAIEVAVVMWGQKVSAILSNVTKAKMPFEPVEVKGRVEG